MSFAKSLARSAFGGMVMGVALSATGCSHEGAPPQEPQPEGTSATAATPTSDAAATAPTSGPASGSAGDPSGAKACCKGKNECKGKGDCRVAGAQDCKGMNECKGKGGCNKHCEKK